MKKIGIIVIIMSVIVFLSLHKKKPEDEISKERKTNGIHETF